MTQQPYYPQQQGYPPQQQQYAPPAQAQPQYPTYPPQQGYAPQQQMPPQGYPAQQIPGAQQQLAQGTIDDFYNQPSSGGGPSLKFEQVGTRYIGIVTRPLGSGDVQQQTDTQGRPLFFKDGRPKFVMKVPLQMQPSPAYPDGIAQWYVKGGTKDELNRAMAEAHAPEGAPEAGAIIDVTFTGTRNSGPGMNPAKVFQVRYTRPEGAAPVAPQGQPAADATSPAPAVEQQVQQPQAQVPQQAVQQVPQQPVQQPLPPQQYAQQQVPQQAPVQQAPQNLGQGQPAPAPQGAPTPPSDLSPEQQQLLAKLQGAQG